MKLRVWWIPQIPMTPFYWRVTSLFEAKSLLEALVAYDQFQYENKIKPDYSNAGGLHIFNTDSKDWEDWENDSGQSIDDIDYSEITEMEYKNG